MNDADLIQYIQNPDLLNKESLEQIKKLVSDYPYFQTAHKLLLKNLQSTNQSEFNDQLSFASIHITERDLLFYYLNDKKEVPSDEQQIAKPEPEEEIKEEEKAAIEKSPDTEIKEPEKTKLLKNKDVRRKIKEGAEGMGDNIAVTISSQLEFVKTNRKEELEYSPEIYFIEEEKPEKVKLVTIETLPSQPDNLNGKDLLQIDESLEIENAEELTVDQKFSSDIEQSLELIETAEKIQENKKPESKAKSMQGFDISHYADEDEILKNADENDLISKFIAVNPRIEPVEKYIDDQKDISEHSTREDDNLLTETLAKVYIAQGYFDKAIKSYEKLCLKYPEKNTYFAGQIEMIKELINKQKNK